VTVIHLNFLLLLSLLSPLYRVFIIIYLKETIFLQYKCCSCSVVTVCATGNVISLVKYILNFYISTFPSMCVVPNMAVFGVP
jgi:hypothetical protein